MDNNARREQNLPGEHHTQHNKQTQNKKTLEEEEAKENPVARWC
jgi:hypothetical protein